MPSSLAAARISIDVGPCTWDTKTFGSLISTSIGLRVPEQIGLEAQQYAVDDQAAVVVTGEAITATARSHPGNVLGEQLVQQALGVRPLELQRKFPGMQHRGFLAQLPVAFLDVQLVETAGHFSAVVHTVMRPERAFDHVVGMT
jgi:hypothetical protein